MNKDLDAMAEQEYNQRWQEKKSGKGGFFKKIGKAIISPLNILAIIGALAFPAATLSLHKAALRESQKIEVYDKEHAKYLAEQNLLKPAKDYAKESYNKHGLSGSLFYADDVDSGRSYGPQDSEEGDKLVYYKRKIFKVGADGKKVEDILPGDASPKDKIFFGENKNEVYYKTTKKETHGEKFGMPTMVYTFDGNLEPGFSSLYPSAMSLNGEVGMDVGTGGGQANTKKIDTYYKATKTESGKYKRAEIKAEDFKMEEDKRNAEKAKFSNAKVSEKRSLEGITNTTNAFIILILSIILLSLSGISVTGMAIASPVLKNTVSFSFLLLGCVYLVSCIFIAVIRMIDK